MQEDANAGSNDTGEKEISIAEKQVEILEMILAAVVKLGDDIKEVTRAISELPLPDNGDG